MNVQGAWAEGITGRDVVVTILDDGLEKDHPDLKKNYVSLIYEDGIRYSQHVTLFNLCNVVASVLREKEQTCGT